MKSTKHIFGGRQKNCTKLILHPSSLFFFLLSCVLGTKNVTKFGQGGGEIFLAEILKPPLGSDPYAEPQYFLFYNIYILKAFV